MKLTRGEYLEALSKAHEDEESFKLVEQLICKHFSMIDHMKETSLYDVYTYEERFTKTNMAFTETLFYDNSKLKKEVNTLRKQLGLSEKYQT